MRGLGSNVCTVAESAAIEGQGHRSSPNQGGKARACHQVGSSTTFRVPRGVPTIDAPYTSCRNADSWCFPRISRGIGPNRSGFVTTTVRREQVLRLYQAALAPDAGERDVFLT